MTTSFSSLPIVDLSDLRLHAESIPDHVGERLSSELYDVFATTGFAYLINAPLTFNHDEIFALARDFFGLPLSERIKLAKKTFEPSNPNTYRGYFPVQPVSSSDNLKEGFEMGPTKAISTLSQTTRSSKFNLAEPNVWPDDRLTDNFRERMELFYAELQALSSKLLSLLARSLGKDPTFFDSYLQDSLSTLRLLHYPTSFDFETGSSSSLNSNISVTSGSTGSYENTNAWNAIKLSCTPHTDSGILTLLHQDATGGLEVRNAIHDWIPAPYIPGSIVVNIGDLMAEVSGGRFVATMHRVRATTKSPESSTGGKFGRFSVPFFFEPGETCVVRSVNDEDEDEGIMYGTHVRSKMKTWIEFQDDDNDEAEVERQ